MTVIVAIAKSFKSAAKPLLKKYPSLSKDLLTLEADTATITDKELKELIRALQQEE